MTERDTSKLPKWVLDHINDLGAQAEQAKILIDAQKPTRVFYGGTVGRPRRYLPDGRFSPVTFQLSDDENDWIMVRPSDSGKGVHITAAHTLEVHPQASNTANLFNSWEVRR